MGARGWIKLAVVAVVVVGAVAIARRERKPEPTEVVTSQVRRATVIRKIRAAGHVEPVTQVKVSANISGDVKALHVDEGDTVKRGALLAEIDRERFAAIVRQAGASARSVQATVSLERAQLKQARAEAKRATDLHAQGLNTDAEADRAASRVEIIEARLRGAEQRVEQAQASLDEAKARLQQTRLVAPIDGTVIRLAKKLGERVRGSDLAEDSLLTLAPLHAMEVEVAVSEQEVVGVEEGQIAEIEVDALGDTAIPGRVVEIASSATIRFRGDERETTTFAVTVALDEIPAQLRSGMSASVSIVTDTHDGALAVPIEAVTARLPSALAVRAEAQRKKKRKLLWEDEPADPRITRRREKPVRIVFVVDKGLAEPRRVKTGISSDKDIEILDGLKPGDAVIIGPYRALARELLPGSPIEVTETVDASGQEPAPKVTTAERSGS